MAKINLLDKSVYNLISAGEVVENPASIVKELVENSIDAGADSISVNIENGGIKSITVIDNGSGIEESDLPLSILPHATSKITTAADLNVIGTLGFRGEALASIAAVSEITVKSRYFEEDYANYISVKGGEIIDKGICGLNVGTQISVKSLFYNTPARFKFLKNAKGEEGKVTQLLRELIFANPEISFTYTADGKNIFRTDGSGLKSAVISVYGSETAENMLPLNLSDKGYKISGFTARPASDAIKNNRTRQVFIVNGRVIADDTISAVIQNAYGEFLMKRTFPAVVLDIIAPFDAVDVNVHPNKREVRFAERSIVNGLIYHAIKNTVEENAEQTQKKIFDSLFNLSAEKSTEKDKVQKSFTILNEDNAATVADIYSDIESNSDKNSGIDTPEFKSEVNNYARPFTTRNFELQFNDYYQNKNAKTLQQEKKDVIYDDFADVKISENENKINYKPIGQLFDTYLLLELDNELILLDQHAAHERLLFDRLIADCEKKLAVQETIIPFTYKASEEECLFIKSIRNDLEKLGFRTEFAENEVLVYSVPCILANLDIGGFLRELSDYNGRFDKLTSSALIKDKIAKIACKRAIKGGDALNDEQIDKVLEYFFSNGVPLQCPHGRPTLLKITRDEIERRFGRKV